MSIKRDRLSIHIENQEADATREAVTVLRNGGTGDEPGLVGVTNNTYDASQTDGCDDIFLPHTLLHVHSSGQADIRFSSGPNFASQLELTGNGSLGARASGLAISYRTFNDDGTANGNEPAIPGSDDVAVDFALIRAESTTGKEYSHLAISNLGYVGVGISRVGGTRNFVPNEPLTVSYHSTAHPNSGTISMREQDGIPTPNSAYGKIYVKPYTIGGATQALYFLDDGGNETNLVLSQDIAADTSTDGLIFGDDPNGNTYGGWYTPGHRISQPALTKNTYFGWGVGHDLINDYGMGPVPAEIDVTDNTLIGYLAGSGLTANNSNYNTVLGSQSLVGFTSAQRNVIIGDNNVNGGGGNFGGMDDSIIIGRSLYNGSLPQDGTLSIGMNSPLIQGSLISDKYISIHDGYFAVNKNEDYQFKIYHSFDGSFSRYTTIFDIKDYNANGSDYPESNFKLNFSNENDTSILTMFEMDPRGAPMTNTPTYQAPVENRPFAKIEGDFKLRGAIRFQDGTSLSGISELDIVPTLATSGVSKVFQIETNDNYYVLDFSSLELAGNVSNDIRTDNTFVSVQLDGSDSSNIGKMSLQGLADYITEGQSSIAENCNVLISNAENEVNVNTALNSNTTMIGCNVATAATGWVHSVFLGSQAGQYATTPNGDLTIDTASVFIGYRAGYDCDDVDNIICIGTNAGNKAKSSSKSIFIGSNAGLNVTYDESIGIGQNALRGSDDTDESEGGVGNVEIVCGLLDNQRLMFEAGAISNRLNIQNSIAGRSDRKNISIGEARLEPTAPLEVRRSSLLHDENGNDYIQSWYCDGVLVASIDCEGVFNGGEGTITVEGLLNTTLNEAGGIASETTALLDVYVDGTATGNQITVTNRDSALSASPGTYMVVKKIGTEYRPIWVSC